jgi:ATP-binding cassette subfamily F protein 3
MSETDGRSYLAQYLFRGDDVFKAVSTLSGGERGRLALALLALDGANFLLLDEPTNHLDIPSQEVLQEVLEAFTGTIVLVSHDRYLVDRLATQIWELRDNHLHAFTGTYQEFLAVREGRMIEGDTAVSKVTLPIKVRTPEPVALDWVADILPPAMNKKERRHTGRRLSQLQDEIEETEAWLDQLAYDLGQAQASQDEARQQQLLREQFIAQSELQKLSTELDALLDVES